MKTLIITSKDDPIHLEDVDISKHIVAYKQKSSINSHERWSYGILHRLQSTFTGNDHERYGFTSLKYTIGAPTYAAKTWEECIKKCAKVRDVKVFDNVEELLEAILEKDF